MCNLKNKWHKDKSQTFKYVDYPSDINSVAGWLKKTSLKRKATWKPFITTPWTLDKRIMFYLANNLSDNWLDNILKRPLWRRGCCLHTAQNYQYQTSGWYSAAYITHLVGLNNLWLEKKGIHLKLGMVIAAQVGMQLCLHHLVMWQPKLLLLCKVPTSEVQREDQIWIQLLGNKSDRSLWTHCPTTTKHFAPERCWFCSELHWGTKIQRM